jgi:2-aminoadipate transaminase
LIEATVKIPGLNISAASDVPVYRQIADGIRAALQDGRLETGAKLPPTRDLARALGVNRNTVVAAYDALAAEGLVTSHTGRGTFVAAPGRGTAPQGAGAPTFRASDAWQTSFSRAVDGPAVAGLLSAYRVAMSSEGISFAGSYPAAELMPVEAFRKALDAVLARRGAEILSYGPTAGFPPLRDAIAEEMRRKGSTAWGDGILLTSGSQQAVDLVFRTMLDRGDAAVIEEPTYSGALSALASLGARIVSVPMDDDGIRPDLLAAALERHRPRLLYLQPTFHNPTARVMSEPRRLEVLSLASRFGCAVVEDDWASDLRFEGTDVPTLHALDAGRGVVYLSTFSKKLLPGIRVGWVAAPPAVLERLVALKQIEDHGSSPLLQAALHEFLAGGGLAEHLDRVLPAYKARRDIMLRAMERHFPEGVAWTKPAGGLFLWVTLPRGIGGPDLFVAARERRVLFSPGELFHSDGSGSDTLRLTYASVQPAQIESGIAVLGELVRERSAARTGAAARRVDEAVPIL